MCKQVFAALVDTSGDLKNVFLLEPGGGNGAVKGWLAFRERACLVDDDGIDLAHRFDSCGVPEQDTLGSGAACRRHDRHRRRQAEPAGTRNDQYRDSIDESIDLARFGPE